MILLKFIRIFCYYFKKYRFGKAEELMGRAFEELKLPREELIVSTKLFKSSNDNVNDMFLSRKHICEGIKNSIKRLRL